MRASVTHGPSKPDGLIPPLSHPHSIPTRSDQAPRVGYRLREVLEYLARLGLQIALADHLAGAIEGDLARDADRASRSARSHLQCSRLPPLRKVHSLTDAHVIRSLFAARGKPSPSD